VLIVTGTRPPSCAGPQYVFDRQSLKASGTVALYHTPAGELRSESVADIRGRRPWSMPVLPRGPRKFKAREVAPSTSSADSGGVGRYAAPKAVADAFELPLALRPEVEEDEP
jgi:hypothetical protein